MSSNTGAVERQEWEEHSPWWSIHVSRYRFAAGYVRGQRVLDVACGTGYGASILLKAGATQVMGVDSSYEAALTAASTARQVTAREAEAFAFVADACRLPFQDGSFDVVTSFETIEHLHARREFLREIRRVLRPGGLCILSTPNALYTRPLNGVPENPFHVHEYTPEELKGELEQFFGEVVLLGQELSSRFVISPFYSDQIRMPKKLRPQALRFTWRVLNRAPTILKDSISRSLWGHPFTPTEEDYVFTSESLQRAPVQVALCRE